MILYNHAFGVVRINVLFVIHYKNRMLGRLFAVIYLSVIHYINSSTI